MLVIDTDTNCSHHIEHLKAEGVTHVGRYYARAGTKRITKTEAQLLSDAGLSLFVVYEDSGDPELSIDRGRNDAQLAYNQARALGQPADAAIYFALEHQPNGYDESHIAGLKLYFEGIRRTLKEFHKIGCYSNGTTLAALLDAKLIDFAWVSASTSFHGSHDFLKTDRWHLAQRKVDQNWQGVSVDTNDVKHEEFGAFRLPPPIVIADASSPQGEEGAAIGTAAAALIPSPNPSPPGGEEQSAWMAKFSQRFSDWSSDWAMARVSDLANNGSRIGQAVGGAFRSLWRGRVVKATATGVVTYVGSTTDTSHGWGKTVYDWAAGHPFLLLAIGMASLALYYEVRHHIDLERIRQGLLSAWKDGRYWPRGGEPKQVAPATGA